MAFIPTNKKVMEKDAEGNYVLYVEGTHHTGDELPTENIFQGSWSMNLDTNKVSFFHGQSWGE